MKIFFVIVIIGAAAIALALFIGFNKRPRTLDAAPTQTQEVAIPEESIPVAGTQGPTYAVEDTRADIPTFQRTYTAKINREVSIKVTIKWAYSSLMKSGELDQLDGKWILFDPDAPADKILDRDILPPIKKVLAEIISADSTWRAARPDQFTDEGGATWRRTSK